MLAQSSGLVVSHPDCGDHVGREPDEPGVLLVVGGAGFSGDVHLKLFSGPVPCARVHHLLEEPGGEPSDLGFDNLFRL